MSPDFSYLKTSALELPFRLVIKTFRQFKGIKHLVLMQLIII